MNRFRIFLALLIAAGAVIFALRHHSLRELQAEQELLQRATAETPNAPPAIAEAPAPEMATNAGLSAEERSELLRLRGQIGGLRQEFVQATNQLAKMAKAPRPRAPSSGTPDEPVVTREEMIQRVNRGKQWMVALLVYAADHQDQLPATLGEAAPADLQIGSMDEFEYVLGSTNINSIKSPATTFVLREKQSSKNDAGRWVRTYAFADGHVEIARSDTNDFTDWEAKHRPPENPATPQ